MTAEAFSSNNLESLYARSPIRPGDANHSIVVFSDLHMGNGSGNDQFITNADLFHQALQRYYYWKDFELVLNGDVEELQRFSMRRIRSRWQKVFDVFTSFASEGRLTRIVGNHDIALWNPGDDGTDRVIESLRIGYDVGEVFIFHGHQTSRWYEKHNHWAQFGLRYLANPLRIKNRTVAHSSRKRFLTERRVYDFAADKKILAIIGHTHRPLFESMSKIDSLQFEIERLCRKYPDAKKPGRIAERVEVLKRELLELAEKEAHGRGSLYREHLVVPGVFNSGCVLGKRGMTALEIEKGTIRLVYWFDKLRTKKRERYRNEKPVRLHDTTYYRVVVKEEPLSYIFSRIQLLA